MSNAIVITNPLRNFKVKDFLQEIGFREFYSECDEFPEWDLYKIVVIHEIDQYVVVPYWKDNEEVIRDVMQFLA